MITKTLLTGYIVLMGFISCDLWVQTVEHCEPEDRVGSTYLYECKR